MSWLSSFMHPSRPYKDAQNELNKYYNEGQQYLQPYNQQGQEQYGNINNAINALMNPQQLQDEWSKGYKESEGAKIAQGMATEHGLDAANSMGLMGSTPAIQAIQAGTTKIGLDEKQKYLDDLMQKYLAGTGLSQNVYNTGAGAGGNMSQNAMNMGQNSAGLKFGESNAPGQAFGGALGTAGKLFANYLTGGMGSGSYGRGAWS